MLQEKNAPGLGSIHLSGHTKMGCQRTIFSNSTCNTVVLAWWEFETFLAVPGLTATTSVRFHWTNYLLEMKFSTGHVHTRTSTVAYSSNGWLPSQIETINLKCCLHPHEFVCFQSHVIVLCWYFLVVYRHICPALLVTRNSTRNQTWISRTAPCSPVCKPKKSAIFAIKLSKKDSQNWFLSQALDFVRISCIDPRIAWLPTGMKANPTDTASSRRLTARMATQRSPCHFESHNPACIRSWDEDDPTICVKGLPVLTTCIQLIAKSFNVLMYAERCCPHVLRGSKGPYQSYEGTEHPVAVICLQNINTSNIWDLSTLLMVFEVKCTCNKNVCKWWKDSWWRNESMVWASWKLGVLWSSHLIYYSDIPGCPTDFRKFDTKLIQRRCVAEHDMYCWAWHGVNCK